MADEAAGGTGETLTASVVEQLREKAEIEREAESSRRDEEQLRERTERRKADEQATVLAHTGGERRLRPPRGDAARAADLANDPRWLPLVAVGAGLVAIGSAGRGLRRVAIIALGAALATAGVLARRGAAVHL
ncbi:MAG: hypothetical protein ACJ79R_15430 [Anaeromyxobacteraceae bacterium]